MSKITKKIIARTSKPKKDFNQSKNLIYASYMLVTSLTLLAWTSIYNGTIKGFSIPSLLAILGFGYMWVHYFAAYLKTNYEPGLSLKKSFKFTQYFVLVAIIAHPLLIILDLKSSGFGLPPSSFKEYFGVGGALFISLGTISLLAFLSFELKNVLKKRPRIWRAVLSLNDLAMLLIILHGFKLGFVIKGGWFQHVWLFYGLSLLYFFYDKYVNKGLLKKYVEGFIVGVIIFLLAFISLATDRFIDNNNSSNQQGLGSSQNQDSEDIKVQDSSQVKISLDQLAEANGLNGQDCWVAIDGTVYDATNNSEWENGQHIPSMGQAKCGEDLSDVIGQSPHGKSVLSDLNVVGKLES